MEKYNLNEEEILTKGERKNKNETKRKEAIGGEKVDKNYDKVTKKDEADLKRDKTWYNDDTKTETVEKKTNEGEKEYPYIEKEEKKDLYMDDSREVDMKDYQKNEEGQKDIKMIGNMEISGERLEGIEERKTVSLPLPKVPLQRPSISDKKKKKEELKDDRNIEAMKDEKNNKEGQKDTKKTGNVGISDERLDGIEERETASLQLASVPLQRSTLSNEKEKREKLEEEIRLEDMKDKINNEEGQKDTNENENMKIGEEKLEGTEGGETVSLPLPTVPLQRSSLSHEKDERKELEEDRRIEDIIDKKNNEGGEKGANKNGNMEISEKRLMGGEQGETASLPLHRGPFQTPPLSDDFEKANRESSVQRDIHRRIDIVQSEDTSDKTNQQSSSSKANSKKV